MLLYTYDIETYPNVFSLVLIGPDDVPMVFEISERRNDTVEILGWLQWLRDNNAYMVGFNNDNFDYTVIHELIKNPSIGYDGLYQKANSIINFKGKWPPKVWPRDQFVKQLDLYKICHFDNKARSTSLKMLEFNMRSTDIQDLPYKPGTTLTDKQIDLLIEYNIHDVKETKKFLNYCMEAIEFRMQLIPTLGPEVINYNDTKIGKQYFINELEKTGQCYHYVDGKKKPIQTPRPQIHLNEIIFNYVQFNSPHFNCILEHLKTQTITETLKAPELNVSAYYGGIIFQFGNGGMHASVDGATVETDDDHLIIDLDVASYYPNLAIANGLYPEHLGKQFCDIYKALYEQRKQYPKGSAENKMLKLALNGVYGDSNNQYSPFYDPKYTMSITVNGQLLLCMLAEALVDKVPGLTLIQVNTDGLTVKVPKAGEAQVMEIAEDWELTTALDLERADYSRMFIRDVNNYIAEYTDGKLKNKGAYEHINLDWHKNHSALIIQKAAEAALVRGEDVEQFIRNHEDAMDFMLRTKVPRSSRLEARYRDDNGDIYQIVEEQNICRYFIGTTGAELVKIMPPLPKNPDKEREIGINKGETVIIKNNLTQFFGMREIEVSGSFDYYVKEANKLIKECQKCHI